jgi:hypothetical protein
MLTHQHNPDWKKSSLILDILGLLPKLHSWPASKIYEGANFRTHNLAKWTTLQIFWKHFLFFFSLC